MKEERFSSGTPSKNKISNFGAISPLYPNFIYHSLSLSLSLSHNLKENERTEKKKDIYVHGLFNSLYIWHFESVSLCIVKDSCIFNVTTWSKLFFAVLLWICCVTFPFSASVRLMLSCLVLSNKFLWNITRETGVADYYNIILLLLNLEVHIFHCLGGGRKAARWVCG